jgi:hypothetical protein
VGPLAQLVYLARTPGLEVAVGDFDRPCQIATGLTDDRRHPATESLRPHALPVMLSAAPSVGTITLIVYPSQACLDRDAVTEERRPELARKLRALVVITDPAVSEGELVRAPNRAHLLLRCTFAS